MIIVFFCSNEPFSKLHKNLFVT